MEMKKHHLTCVAFIALGSLALTGCATVKRFAPQEGEPLVDVFPGHEIEPLFENSIYAEDTNIFRLDICQRQPAPPDSSDFKTLSYVRLENLSIQFSGEGEPVHPTPEDSGNPDWRDVLDDGFLHGPIHHWGWLHIPGSCDWIEITYTAVLVDGEGSEESESRTVRQILYRKHDKVPSFYK